MYGAPFMHYYIYIQYADGPQTTRHSTKVCQENYTVGPRIFPTCPKINPTVFGACSLSMKLDEVKPSPKNGKPGVKTDVKYQVINTRVLHFSMIEIRKAATGY